MGNTNSNVTSGIKKQADGSAQQLMELVDLRGGGILVELLKEASKTKNYEKVDTAIRELVPPYLYNGGAGKMVPIARLVIERNKDKPKARQLPVLRNLDDPSELDLDKYLADYMALHPYKDNPHLYREVCFDLDQRGAVGESTLHLCLLNATSIHAELAKRLVRIFPKLINDVYQCDEYYDPAMVKFLLDNGVNYHERCYGTFMSPEDQKATRVDTLAHEWVLVDPETNYEGYVYWGEYPLSFAACLGQEECYRLMLAKGADPNLQDTNGNTVLHMLIIHDRMSTFDMAYELGASLNIRNAQGLIPLTLAAKLAKRDMFFHILKIQREIYWQLGSVTCAAYALPEIDTIDTKTGGIDKNSVLNLVTFGDKDGHLELMEGIVIDLLNAKWNAFVKSRFYRQFSLFCLYFCISLICFTLRPGPTPTRPLPPEGTTTGTATSTSTTSVTQLIHDANPILPDNPQRLSQLLPNLTHLEDSDVNITTTLGSLGTSAVTRGASTSTSKPKVTQLMPPIPMSAGNKHALRKVPISQFVFLLGLQSEVHWVATIRLVTEGLVVLGAVTYLVAAGREAWFLGSQMFFENLATAPSRVLFLFSCILVQLMVVLRLASAGDIEDVIAVLVMLSTAPYFLFYCRGFKKVGPFVVMIYRMIMGDLLRFVTIYVVFVMGFSQAYYIVFLSYVDTVDGNHPNPMPNPIESVMAMFLMSLNNFDTIYDAFSRTNHELVAKILFVVYMAIVAILLINMLIAMMGNTYQKIAETRNEWQRQWARIVLVVERGVTPQERLEKQKLYSRPMQDGRRALLLRLQQTEEDKEEIKEIMELRTNHDKFVLRRQNNSRLLSTMLTPSMGSFQSPSPL